MGEAVQVATEADIVSRNVALTSEEKGGTNSDPSQVLVKQAAIQKVIDLSMIDELEASRGEDEGVNASIGVETGVKTLELK